MYLGGCGKVPAQPLRTRLADMKRSTDGTYRGKAVGRQVIREYNCSALTKRICRGAALTSARCNHWHLLATDDHHQKLIRPDQRDRWPRTDNSADQAMV
jgi:hypothetical protein